jgi:hypothetical protein
MLNLTTTPSSPIPTANSGAGLARAATATAAGAGTASPRTANPAEPQRPVLAQPASRIEPVLGLVVLEFQDITGETRTIPSARELDAYRSAASGAPASLAERQLAAGTDGPSPGRSRGPTPPARPEANPFEAVSAERPSLHPVKD